MKKIFLIIFIFFINIGVLSANQNNNFDCSGEEYAALGIIQRVDNQGRKTCVKKETIPIKGTSVGKIVEGDISNESWRISNYTYINGQQVNNFYNGFFGGGWSFDTRRGPNIGIKLDSNPRNKKVGVPVYMRVPENGEYLITGGADDIFTVKVDGNQLLVSDDKNRIYSWEKYYIFPVYLEKGDHFFEFYYEDTGVNQPSNLQYLSAEISGPFDPGSFIDHNTNTIKSVETMRQVLSSEGNVNYNKKNYSSYGRYDTSIIAPKAYVDRIKWNTRKLSQWWGWSSSIGQSGFIISDHIHKAGLYCPDGYHIGHSNPSGFSDRFGRGSIYTPDVCIRYVPINQEDIDNQILLNNDYKADGFFTKTDTINVGNTERTSCPNGFSFPRDNSTNIYKPKENNFKCITPDPEIHKSFKDADPEPYPIKIGQNSGITSCGHGAKVVRFVIPTNTIYCKRTLTDLNGSYAKAFENKEIYIYSYNEGLKYKGGIMEMGLEQENSKNNYDNKFAEGRFIGPISFRNVSTDSYKDDLKAGNYREYTIKFDKMCVGFNIGCKTNKPENININVYANNLVANAGNTSTDYNKFTNGSLFANGQKQDLVYKPIDNFNNYILPVKKESGEKIRDLNFEIFYKNSLYANQYNKTGASGIKSTTFYNNVEVWDNTLLGIKSSETKISKRLDETSIKDGQYKLSFKAYTPTYKENTTDGRQYAYGNVELFRPTIKLSDNSNAFSLGGNLNLQFKPKFVTNITGSIIKDGLVVGAKQDSVLRINGSGNPRDVLLEYGKLDGINKVPHNNFELSFNKSGAWNTIVSGRQANSDSLTSTGFTNTSNNLNTLMRQKGSIVDLNDKTYLATHIKDEIDQVKVVYSSFAIGLKNYELGEKDDDKNNTFQRRIKISGTVHSHSKSEVFNTEKIVQLGNIDKSELQKHIRKRVIDNIRNIKNLSKTGVSSISNLNNLSSNGGVKVGDTLYFEKDNGENITISGSYSGVKNIVIYGGNAYITGNIIAGNKKNDILSIISVEKNGKGGNIYIKPSVEKIDSVLYADKAVLSYDGTKELDPDNGGTYELLKNQLYIYGSVFSNNTIGGSVLEPFKCPFYEKNCNLGKAEKYDLYNLRRGYENIYNTSGGKKPYEVGNLKPENVGKDLEYTLIIEYNPLIQSSKNPFFTVKK